MRHAALVLALLCFAPSLGSAQKARSDASDCWNSPCVHIRDLAIETTHISAVERNRIVQRIKTEQSVSGTLDQAREQISELVRDHLQQLGYFMAVIMVVDVLVAADEGRQYRLKDIVFTRNPR